MKTNLTSLSLPDQVVAVMRVIAQRKAGGQRVTFSSDLLRYFKHHAFRAPKQRLEYFTKLHHIASEALSGKNVESQIKELATTVVWEIGDEADYGHRRVRIVDLPEGDKATILLRDDSVRTVSLSELAPPKLPASSPTADTRA